MHAAVGGAVSGAFGESAIAGAIGGAAGELAPSLMNSASGNNSPPLSKEAAALHQSKITALTKLTATTTALLTGQNASGMGQAAEVAGSAVENNYFLHPKPTWEQEVRRQEQLEEAGKALNKYVKENPIEAASYAVDAATLISTSGLALTSVALKKATQQAMKQGAKAVIKQKGKNSGKNVVASVSKKSSDKAVKSVDKAASKANNQAAKKLHKNSNNYKGDTHVYKIVDKTKNKTHKVGESAAGVRKIDGKSKRAEAQVRRLERETGGKFRTKIIRNHGSKKQARKHEHELIKRYRKIFEKEDGILPGNKGNR